MNTNTTDRTDELADRLRATFAAVMPLLDAPDADLAEVRSGAGGSGGTGYSRVLVGAAAALLVVGGVVALAAPRDVAERAADQTAVGFTPAGEEFPPTEIDLAGLAPGDLPAGIGRIARPGSVVIAAAPGLDGWSMVYDAIDYTEFSGTVQPWRCEEQPGAALCQPVEMRAVLGSETGDRERWMSVPEGTEWVGYVDGDGRALWQRPVGPISVFPSSAAPGTFTAYAADGRVIETFDVEQYMSSAPSPYDEQDDTLSSEQRETLHSLTVDVLRDCLNAAGATYSSGEFFPELPSSAPPNTWDDCVATTKHAVDQQFVNWAARLLPVTPVAAGSPIAADVVERGMPAAAVVFAGTVPTCATSDVDVFSCVLTNPPFWDGDPSMSAADFDFTSMIQGLVDDNWRVIGGCRSEEASGMTWTCVTGQKAIDEQMVGPGLLGQIVVGPSSG